MSSLRARLKEALLAIVPPDGATIGNTALRRGIESRLATEGVSITEEDYWQAETRGQETRGQETRGLTIQQRNKSRTGGEFYCMNVRTAPISLAIKLEVEAQTRSDDRRPQCVVKRCLDISDQILGIFQAD